MVGWEKPQTFQTVPERLLNRREFWSVPMAEWIFSKNKFVRNKKRIFVPNFGGMRMVGWAGLVDVWGVPSSFSSHPLHDDERQECSSNITFPPKKNFPHRRHLFCSVSETGVSNLAAPPTDATTVFSLLFKREKAFLPLQTGTKKLATKGKRKKKEEDSK